MKSIIAMFVALAVASVASADIAIDLVNSAGYGATADGSNQYVVQLVANNAGAATTVDASNLLGTGDNLLTSFTTDAAGYGTFASQGIGEYATPASGNVVIRIFDLGAGNGDVGSQWEVAAAAFTEYNSLTPSTIYTTEGLVSSPFTLGTSGTAVNVIPEPATIGLLGIAGAGLYAARRKTVA